jgi:hypothetical protein
VGKTRTGRTASCLYCTKELEHALALALSWVRAKVTANCTEGVCLELIPWDLGRGRHRELSLRAEADKWKGVREAMKNCLNKLDSEQTRWPNRVRILARDPSVFGRPRPCRGARTTSVGLHVGNLRPLPASPRTCAESALALETTRPANSHAPITICLFFGVRETAWL